MGEYERATSIEFAEYAARDHTDVLQGNLDGC